MGPRGRFYPYLCILHILDCLGQDMQVLYLGRAPCTKETLPDFLKWRRVTRPPLVFRELTGSQRTPGFWGVTKLGPRSGSGRAYSPLTSQRARPDRNLIFFKTRGQPTGFKLGGPYGPK